MLNIREYHFTRTGRYVEHGASEKRMFLIAAIVSVAPCIINTLHELSICLPHISGFQATTIVPPKCLRQ